MKYNRRIAGPDITRPFTVTSGLVAVRGEISICLPAGATWPGLDQLPDWMAEQILPEGADLIRGAAVHARPPTPRDIEAGIALVHALLLQGAQVPLDRRLTFASRDLAPRTVHQATLAAVIGCARVTLTRLLVSWSNANP